MSKQNKSMQGPSLYKQFVEAYMKAHPQEKQSIRHENAQIEWTKLKSNEEFLREKIEEYLQIYNESLGIKQVNQIKIIENLSTDDDDNDNDDDEQMKTKKIYYGKKKKTVLDEDISLEDLNENPSLLQVQFQPLDAKKRQPKQQEALNALNSTNQRISSLVQLRQMGLSTPENTRELKQLMIERKKAAAQLKRLQLRIKASSRYRNKQRKVIEELYDSRPELRPQLKRLYRRGGGKPRIEEQCPNLLEIIEEIAKSGGARSDDKRRSQTIRPCLTLDDLREKIKQRGYDIKRSTLYYRLLPHRAKSIDGRRHVYTAPVRLRRAQNDEHGKHEDGHFATATIRYVKDLASIFGNDSVFYVSQDDKCKVPIGLPAARVQAPMLMHLDYRIRLPDHDWIVAPRHQLIPSVYAACILNPDGQITHSGPTYIAVRSAKHDLSTAQSHAEDFHRLVQLDSFQSAAKDQTGQIKPIVIIAVDGGPDENPRFPKTLVASIQKFRTYNLDALFVVTHAPGQSAYNIVESRMAPLSHDIAGLILPHDFYGSHLNDSGVTTNVDLEKMNFRKAGQMLAERWNQSTIDGFPCFAEYINPPVTSVDQRISYDVKFVISQMLNEICHDEEDEEGREARISARNQYHEENARPAREKFGEDNKYDIDEYWCATHVLQTQYTLQIIRCDSVQCCGQWRSNYLKIFPHRFLPAPVPFERTPYGIRMTDRDCQKGQFYGSLFQRIQFHGVVIQHTQNEILPFDFCCSSVKKELKKRTCQVCHQYIPSAYRMKNHYKIHAQHYEQIEDQDFDKDMDELQTIQDKSPVVKLDILDWIQNDIE